MKRFLGFLAFLALLAGGLRQARAESVLLLSTGNTTNDSAVVTLLQAEGDTVTVGPVYYNYTGGGLAGYNAVILLQNNSNIGENMPDSGQTALVNYVKAGGGLLTGEWTVWGIGVEGYNQILKTIIPVIPQTNYDSYNYNSPITYTLSTPNAILNTGLPSSFTFNADNNGGTQTYFQPQPGATVFYGSDFGNNGAGTPPGDGVIGWTDGLGRVLSLSTLAGPIELTDPNYGTLFSNGVNWVSAQAAIPEPSSIALLGIGAVALALQYWRCRTREA
jgi:PEP-CTERM motif